MTAFAVIVVGLPLAVELNDTWDNVGRASATARAGDAEPLSSPVMLSDRPALTLDRGLVSSENTFAARTGNATTLLADEATLTLDLSRPGEPLQTTGIEPGTLAVVSGMKASTVKVRRGTLVVISPSGSRHVVKKLNASLTSARPGSFRLRGIGVVDGQRLSLDGTWHTQPSRQGPTAAMPMRLSLSGTLVEANFDGTLTAGGPPVLTGSAELRFGLARRLMKWIGLGAQSSDYFQSFVVTGPLEWSQRGIAFARAKVDLDGHVAIGALTLKHDADRLAVDGTLAFDELDLRRVLASGQARDGATGSPTKEPVLSHFDADLRLSATSILTPAVTLGRAAATITLNRGNLQAGLVGVEIGEGVSDAQITVDLNQPTPQAVVTLKARNIDAGGLMAASLKHNPLIGRANVTFEGTARGRSMPEAIAKLAGHGKLELAEPGRLGLDVAALTTAAKAKPVVSWAAAGHGSTALDSLRCTFRLINGAVTIENLQGRAGRSALFSSGRVDVPGRLMDINLASAPASMGEAPLTADSLLSMRGTWENPSISHVRPPQPSTVATWPVATDR